MILVRTAFRKPSKKIERAPEPEIRWHLLGHLQTNKARKAAAAFATIQSVDSVELLQKIDLAAVEAGTTPELLIQVEVAHEATKFGAPPLDVPRLFEAAARLEAARVVGLMTLPPVPQTPEEARPWFRRLRDLRDEWLASGVPAPMLRELSMGMSGDFEVAIQEGATMVAGGNRDFWAPRSAGLRVPRRAVTIVTGGCNPFDQRIWWRILPHRTPVTRPDNPLSSPNEK